MKTTAQQLPPPPSPITIDAPLSPQWAFVIQFRAIEDRSTRLVVSNTWCQAAPAIFSRWKN